MQEFIQFIAEILEVEPGTLTLDSTQEEIETWDSLMQLRLVGEVETRYGITIPMDEISDIKTIGDFYRFVK